MHQGRVFLDKIHLITFFIWRERDFRLNDCLANDILWLRLTDNIITDASKRRVM